MLELIRTRWAAVGAAVAVSLGAGGISLTQAAISSGEMPVYVALTEPCRLVDTRPAAGPIGPKGTPISAGETNAYEIQVTGANGDCTGGLAIPADAVAVATNVTAIAPSSPTGRSFFTVYPADAALPNTSNVNFLSGQAPVANKVDVGLSATGKIKIYNDAGTAHAAVDVFGYYVDHVHTGDDIVDGSLTSADIADGTVSSADIADGTVSSTDIADGTVTSTDIADGTVTGTDIADESVTGTDIDDGTVTNIDTSNEPGVAYDFMTTTFTATTTPTAVASTAIRVPSDGYVEIEVTGLWRNQNTSGSDVIFCQLQKGTPGAVNTSEPWFRLDDGGSTTTAWDTFSAHRMMPISASDNPLLFLLGQSISLVCDEVSGSDVLMDEVFISATFYATSYRPTGFIFVPISTTAAAGPASDE